MHFILEELSIDAWPAVNTLLYDGWVIRLSNGYGNRGNSVSPLYPSRINQEEKIKYCDELFNRHNLPATYKLVGCEEHKDLEHRLEELGYQKINETSVQTCEIEPEGNLRSLSLARRRVPVTGKDYEGFIVKEEFDDPWINSVIEYNKIEEKNVGAFKTILSNIAMEKIVIRKEVSGEIAGCGYGVIGGGYVGVFDIVVKESMRGKGFGREIVETILHEGFKRGAKKSYLQVMINNPVALRLYEKLKYREAYRYWYRKKTLIPSASDSR